MHLHFILLFICKFRFLFFSRGELFEVKRGPELPIQEKYVLLLTQFFFFFKSYFFQLGRQQGCSLWCGYLYFFGSGGSLS